MYSDRDEGRETGTMNVYVSCYIHSIDFNTTPYHTPNRCHFLLNVQQYASSSLRPPVSAGGQRAQLGALCHRDPS